MIPVDARLNQIALARRSVLEDRGSLQKNLIDSWIERSWKRCLSKGYEPQTAVQFAQISSQDLRRVEVDNHDLIRAAKPLMDKLGRAIANTHYFAILTNAQGIVIDANGPIDNADKRAKLISRIGVDLSEHAVGTTAIGAALEELQPVWVHRGEHFFNDNMAFSCAGSPLFGSKGQCIGMLDLTGIMVPERPELKHLTSLTARTIENALLRQQPHNLLLRINWPGQPLGEDTDGLIALDNDGCILGANQTARLMLPQMAHLSTSNLHASDLFAMPFTILFDSSRRTRAAVEVPLWSGLRLIALAIRSDDEREPLHIRTDSLSTKSLRTGLALRDVEADLIKQAVDHARGNIAQAARDLGISRATLYRKLVSNKAKKFLN
jgi:sigma-54 dependent transcriptional regulator, acetoin dehydrogenase operon transcriptional activator AcoR